MKIILISLFLFLFANPAHTSMYDMVNKERTIRNLPVLTIDKQLEKNATKRACEIKKWSHDGAWDYFVNVPYNALGENLAKNFRTDKSAMRAWMNSPSHKANILDKDFTHIGIGYCGIYIVQHFGAVLN